MATSFGGLDKLQQAIGITFSDVTLLQRALTHASYLNENPDCMWGDNERLEYLGDAVIDFVAAEHLYFQFPAWDEGKLTGVRTDLVRAEALARFAQQIELGQHLVLGRGEEQSGGRERVAMLCDAFEALIGALYLDQGLEATGKFLQPFLETSLKDVVDSTPARDAKTRLQEWTQAQYHEPPSYVTVREHGPDHAKEFTVQVHVLGEARGEGVGHSKQAAEQAAAQAALEVLLGQGLISGRDPHRG
jgi:ribonuclease-3